MLSPIPALSDYGISPEHGFLPPETPLDVLPIAYYASWEAIAIDRLPILSTSYLQEDSEWRRAYVVLVFMLHGYVWGDDKPAERVPPALTIPLFEVCDFLELPPVATYAAVCLWNYKPIFPAEPADDLDNLCCINTFTGSSDEQWFYLVSVVIEARGGPTIPLMLRAIAAARVGNSRLLTECLQIFAEILDGIVSLLERMNEHCDPYIFYHRIRPFLAGSRDMGDAGLPNGLIYNDGTGKQEYRQYDGGSNAQSSLIQFFDLVLGIEHRPTGVARNINSRNESGSKPHRNFIQEMRHYMPGPHRRFLEHVSRVANIREYVAYHSSDKALCVAYEACLAMLRVLRDKHIQIVSRYIVVQSRESRSQSQSLGPHVNQNAISLASVKNTNTSGGRAASKKLRGTGGTALIPFLKQARDETGEPAVNAWARRLLSGGPTDACFAPLGKMIIDEHADGQVERTGIWTIDDSEGGILTDRQVDWE
ncbi:Indoleamine 2,3-dioxygenase [Elaphomyces granulatus]